MLLLFCCTGLLWSLCHTDIDLFSFWLIDIRIHERPIDFPAVFIRNTPAVNRAAIAGFSDNLLLIRIGDIFPVDRDLFGIVKISRDLGASARIARQDDITAHIAGAYGSMILFSGTFCIINHVLSPFCLFHLLRKSRSRIPPDGIWDRHFPW